MADPNFDPIAVFRHVIKRDRQGNPVSGVTLCALATGVHPVASGHQVCYVVEDAICSKRDQFSRRIGRTIAYNRAIHGRHNTPDRTINMCAIITPVGTDNTVSAVQKAVRKVLMTHLEEIVKGSSRLSKLATLERQRQERKRAITA